MTSLARGRAVAVFDVCGTLVKEDTTLGFLRFYFSQRGGRAQELILWAISERRSPLNLALRIIERFTRLHIAKRLALTLLKGQRKTELEHVARDYVQHLLRTGVVKPIIDEFELRRLDGARVILASASICVVISALADLLEVEYVSSQLAFEQGRCAGRLATDISGRKPEILNAFLGMGPETGYAYGYSDNFDDLELLRKCEYRTVVLRREFDRRRWTLTPARYVEAWSADV